MSGSLDSSIVQMFNGVLKEEFILIFQIEIETEIETVLNAYNT